MRATKSFAPSMNVNQRLISTFWPMGNATTDAKCRRGSSGDNSKDSAGTPTSRAIDSRNILKQRMIPLYSAKQMLKSLSRLSPKATPSVRGSPPFEHNQNGKHTFQYTLNSIEGVDKQIRHPVSWIPHEYNSKAAIPKQKTKHGVAGRALVGSND